MAKQGTRKPGTSIEKNVVALAEQLGRLVGTVQARTARLSDKVTGRPRGAKPARKSAKASPGRSGGVVDAPGKKHRKPVVTAAPRNVARSQAAKVRDAKPRAKTVRRRGRG